MPDDEPAQQEGPADGQLLCGPDGWHYSLAAFKGHHLNCGQHGFPGPGPNVLL